MFPSLPPYAALGHVYIVHKQDVGTVWPFLVQINGDLASFCFALGELHLFLELQHRSFLLLFVLHQDVDDCSWCISFVSKHEVQDHLLAFRSPFSLVLVRVVLFFKTKITDNPIFTE